MEQLGNPKRRAGRPAGGASAAATDERLAKIAIPVFSRHGYDGATLREVATSAGLTRAAILYHFADKRGLYRRAIECAYTSVVAPAIDEAAHETTLAQQLRTFVNVAGAAIGHDKALAAFLCSSVAEYENHPELRDTDHSPLTATQRFLKGAVERAVHRGELPVTTSDAALADALVAVLSGIGIYAAYVGTPREIHDVKTVIEEQLIKLLQLPPPQSQ